MHVNHMLPGCYSASGQMYSHKTMHNGVSQGKHTPILCHTFKHYRQKMMPPPLLATNSCKHVVF